MAYRRPEPLRKEHAYDEFDRGNAALNEWLKRHAVASHASGGARVYVTVDTETATVVGYYALAAGQLRPRDASPRAAQGQPTHRPIPAVLLARLAVDLDHQSIGIGRSLVQDAMVRTLAAADEIGLRVMLVHAKDDEVRKWYEQFGFDASPTDPLHLILLVKDMRAAVERARR